VELEARQFWIFSFGREPEVLHKTKESPNTGQYYSQNWICTEKRFWTQPMDTWSKIHLAALLHHLLLKIIPDLSFHSPILLLTNSSTTHQMVRFFYWHEDSKWQGCHQVKGITRILRVPPNQGGSRGGAHILVAPHSRALPSGKQLPPWPGLYRRSFQNWMFLL
jgi:hypothetical protein